MQQIQRKIHTLKIFMIILFAFFVSESTFLAFYIYGSERGELKPAEVLTSVKALNLAGPLTTEEIMAAGQLGGLIYPTHEINDKISEVKINLSFGKAMQEWNKHEYKEAVKLFHEHIANYPDSPWVSEAILHMGCDAQYNGRYTEAEENFRWILEENKYKYHDGAKTLLNKAKLRLGVLKVDLKNFEEAKALFSDLLKESPDWRDRTYASHWIQRLSRYTSHEQAMLDCGTRALAYLLEKDGKVAEAGKMLELLPQNAQGHSIRELRDIALQYGYRFVAIKVPSSKLKDLPLPAIMHIDGKNKGDGGHYWILETVNRDTLTLFDPQSGRRFQQNKQEFVREWSGKALVFSEKKRFPGIRLSENEITESYGGCCGTPRPEDDMGPSRYPKDSNDDDCECPRGSPVWSVNMVNMNLYVNDVPLWYDSPIGPSVEISLSYNSQSAIAYNEPFGNKWQFNYGSYLVVDTAGNVTIFMPDGRRDEYRSNGLGGYSHPYDKYNTLTKIAENHYELKFPDDTVYVYNIPQGTTSLQSFLVEIRDSHGQKIILGYDADVKLTTITDAINRVTNLIYDNTRKLVVRVTDPFLRSATFAYDDNRNLVSITDMGGYTSRLTYDENVYLTSIETERGKWDFYIEPADGVTAYSDDYPPPGAHTWESYRITITNPLGDKEEYMYHGGCGYGNCGYSWYVSPKHYVPYVSGSENNFRSAPKTLYYLLRVSGHGEISKVVGPEGDSVSFTYSTGNIKSIQDTTGDTTSFTYDARGNLTKITDPLNNTVEYTYDSHDNLTSLVDQTGNTYIYEYDAKDDLINITNPMNGTTTFTYNDYGQVLTMSDAKSNVTAFAYDTQGNLISMTSPAGKIDSYEYDEVGRVISHADPNGNTMQYDYDDMNRLTKVTYPSGIKTYSYDCCALSTASDKNGTLAFVHDNLKRLTEYTDVYGNVVSYEYDKNGNLISLTYPGSKKVSYEYDNAERLIEVTDWLGNVTRHEYDLIRNIMKTIYPDGSVITHEYDDTHRLEKVTDFKADGTPIAVYGYTLDTLGNRVKISNYQPLNKIPSPRSTFCTYDKDNRILSEGSVTYEYDANGNLTRKTEGNSVTNYTWDYNNMLTQIVSGGDTYSYIYDGLGNRVAKKVNLVEERYVVDTAGALSRILAETNESGNIIAYYVYGLGLISKITPNGNVFYYHYDGLGSTIAITNSSGEIVNKYAYDAFGMVLDKEETVANPFRYVGRFGVMDEGHGLFYMRARYYDFQVGRFINRDPIRFSGGLNMYAYVRNNPINYIDPLGLDRYSMCEQSFFPWLCRRIVDWACERSPQYCCDQDRMSCIADLDPGDPNYPAEILQCNYEFAQCIME